MARDDEDNELTEALTEDQIAELRGRLLDERARLLRRAGLDVAGDEMPEPSDLQEKAADQARLNAMLALSDHDRERLREVEAALARMVAGTYGICEETGEAIGIARLRLEPTTRYTVEALEMLEEERRRERSLEGDDEDDLY